MNSKVTIQCIGKLVAGLCAILVITTQSIAHELITDIPYESPGGMSNALDIYTPDGGVNPDFPTLLYIHGGGWYTGDKAWHAPLHIALADQGYTVISCNYTLSTQVSPSFPQAVHDVKAVVRWIRTVGVSDYNMSPVIVPYGTSAGGHLTMMLQTTAGMDFFEPLPPPPGGYAVQAAVPFFGPTDLVLAATQDGFGNDWRIVDFLGEAYSKKTHDLWALASPITHLDPSDPPLAIYQGIHDETVPFSQSEAMYAASSETGIMTWFFPYDGGHSFAPDLGGHEGAALRMGQIIPAMLANDQNGNTPLTGGDFLVGSKISGNLTSVFHSDNAYLKVNSDPEGSFIGRQIVSTVTFTELGIQDAQTIDIAIESKLNIPRGKLTVSMKNFKQDRFVEVGRFPVGLKETTITLDNLDITNYRNSFGDIELVVRYSGESLAGETAFEVWIDQIHMHVN